MKKFLLQKDDACGGLAGHLFPEHKDCKCNCRKTTLFTEWVKFGKKFKEVIIENEKLKKEIEELKNGNTSN